MTCDEVRELLPEHLLSSLKPRVRHNRRLIRRAASLLEKPTEFVKRVRLERRRELVPDGGLIASNDTREMSGDQ